MATVSVQISLRSVDTSSNVLSLQASDSLSVEEPLEDTSKVLVDTVTASTIVPSTAAVNTYVYLKNTDATNFVTLRTASASADFAVLHPGESCFIVALASVGIEVLADTADCIVEYGYWSKQ